MPIQLDQHCDAHERSPRQRRAMRSSVTEARRELVRDLGAMFFSARRGSRQLAAVVVRCFTTAEVLTLRRAALRGHAYRALCRVLTRHAGRPGSIIVRDPRFKRSPVFSIKEGP